jgi:hypothetical protein
MDETVVAIGLCWSCGVNFGFHPDTVVSIPIDPDNGLPPDLGGDPAKVIKHPVCNGCVEAANPQRQRNGVPLLKPAKESTR